MLIVKTGGGILEIKSKKNAFTLIELLAIIVILAIIAVITVPIILNIIENSRKGAATDSAYGYKDAVNKAYIQELAKPDNGNLKLNGTYEVQSDGTLIPADGYSFGITNYNTLPVSVSGEKPTSGTLTYSNNVLTCGTLIIGDYTATYSNGTFAAIKTSLASNNNPSGESGQGSGGSQTPTNPYLTTFDGNYIAYYWDDTTTDGYNEIDNENYEAWQTFLNPNSKAYLRTDGTKNEVCGVFGSGQTGTVCLTPSSIGYYDDFSQVTGEPLSRIMTQDEQNAGFCDDDGYTSDDEDGNCYFCSEEYDGFNTESKMCYKDEYIATGYVKAKIDEMLSKGASTCEVNADYASCDIPSAHYCAIESAGNVSCNSSGYDLGVYNDGNFHH